MCALPPPPATPTTVTHTHAHRLIDPDTGADKKSICNKFPQACAITSLVWPKDRPNEVVFGLADGKVKLGMLNKNKSYTCYAHPDNSYVVALAASLNGQNVISAHMDGSIWKFNFPAEEGGAPSSSQLVVHPCVPYALGWGSCIAAAGNDNRVCVGHDGFFWGGRGGPGQKEEGMGQGGGGNRGRGKGRGRRGRGGGGPGQGGQRPSGRGTGRQGQGREGGGREGGRAAFYFEV